MSEGFFERWSRRKADVREGRAVEVAPAIEQPLDVAAPIPHPPEGEGAATPQPEQLPAPTLDDVQALTTHSDFTRFVAPDVAPEVKNAALKKLFSDPHFNVMDGLDVYVDDYSQPDPIPDAMLRELASARFLRLFDEKEEQVETGAPRDVADDTGARSVAQSSRVDPAAPEPSVHDDPDLRLQQDDAAQGPEPGRDPE